MLTAVAQVGAIIAPAACCDSAESPAHRFCQVRPVRCSRFACFLRKARKPNKNNGFELCFLRKARKPKNNNGFLCVVEGSAVCNRSRHRWNIYCFGRDDVWKVGWIRRNTVWVKTQVFRSADFVIIAPMVMRCRRRRQRARSHKRLPFGLIEFTSVHNLICFETLLFLRSGATHKRTQAIKLPGYVFN